MGFAPASERHPREFFINGILLSGAQPEAAFEKIIRAELAAPQGEARESLKNRSPYRMRDAFLRLKLLDARRDFQFPIRRQPVFCPALGIPGQGNSVPCSYRNP